MTDYRKALHCRGFQSAEARYNQQPLPKGNLGKT
jgi:hypothetical protein